MIGIKIGILFINLIGLGWTIASKNYQWTTYLVPLFMYFLFVFSKGDDYRKLDFFGKRVLLASNIVLMLFLVIVCRLINIQIFNKETYMRRIDMQSEALVISRGSRGEILDTTGKSLAYNVTNYTVAVDPSRIYGDSDGMRALTEILELRVIATDNKVDKEEFLESLEEASNNRRKYKLLATGISEDNKLVMEEIMRKHRIRQNEIYFRREFNRLYHRREMYQSLVGFVGENDSSNEKRGLFGVERGYDSYLEGKALSRKVRVDRGRRRAIPNLTSEIQKRLDGQNLYLTIDNDINSILNEEIKKKFDDTNAEGAFGIVMDPNNGKILGTASYYRDPNLSVRNGVFQDQVEPGSIFKPIIMAAALNEKYFERDTNFDIGNGTIRKHNHTIREATRSLRGVITAEDILTRSSNTGMVLIGDYFTNENFENYLKNFGLYDVTGVDFPNERKPFTTPYAKWDRLKRSTMSFGQGIAITPVQMATAFSALVNGGTLYRPYLVEKIESDDGIIIRRNVPHPVRRVMTKETSDIMREILETAVVSGTGTRAKVEGYRIGGKTGTGQIPGNGGAYLRDDYLASFIGFFPVEQPRYVILIMVLKPEGNTVAEKYGGTVAAPVFSEIVKRITRIKSIWVTEESTNVTNISIGNVLQNRGTNGSRIELVGEMPDLTGRSSREIIDNFHGTGLTPEIVGVGLVVDQEPKAGTPLENVRTVRVVLGDEIRGGDMAAREDEAKSENTSNNSGGVPRTMETIVENIPNNRVPPPNDAVPSGNTASGSNANAPNTANTNNTVVTSPNNTTANTNTTVQPTVNTQNSENAINTANTGGEGSPQGSGEINYGKSVGRYREIIIESNNNR